jgi:hypothetical protein
VSEKILGVLIIFEDFNMSITDKSHPDGAGEDLRKAIEDVKAEGANNKDKLNIILGKVHDDTTVEMVE